MALGGPALVKADHRRGHLRAGAGRLQGARDQERRRRRRGARTTPSASKLMKRYLSFFPSSCDERAAADLPVTDPIDRREESLLDLLPENPHARLRHVQADPRRRRSRRVPRYQAALRPASIITLPGAHRRPVRSASWPTSRTTSAASSTSTPPTRPRGSCKSATPSTSRSCSSRTCPASWSARRWSTRASSATARSCCT